MTITRAKRMERRRIQSQIGWKRMVLDTQTHICLSSHLSLYLIRLCRVWRRACPRSGHRWDGEEVPDNSAPPLLQPREL
jgi:hypothetical protein